MDEGLTEGRYSLATFIAANNTGTPIQITTEDAGATSTIKLLNQDVSASELHLLVRHSLSRMARKSSSSGISGMTTQRLIHVRSRHRTLWMPLTSLPPEKADATNAQIIAADVNKDGKVSAMDAYSILQPLRIPHKYGRLFA